MKKFLLLPATSMVFEASPPALHAFKYLGPNLGVSHHLMPPPKKSQSCIKKRISMLALAASLGCSSSVFAMDSPEKSRESLQRITKPTEKPDVIIQTPDGSLMQLHLTAQQMSQLLQQEQPYPCESPRVSPINPHKARLQKKREEQKKQNEYRESIKKIKEKGPDKILLFAESTCGGTNTPNGKPDYSTTWALLKEVVDHPHTLRYCKAVAQYQLGELAFCGQGLKAPDLTLARDYLQSCINLLEGPLTNNSPTANVKNQPEEPSYDSNEINEHEEYTLKINAFNLLNETYWVTQNYKLTRETCTKILTLTANREEGILQGCVRMYLGEMDFFGHGLEEPDYGSAQMNCMAILDISSAQPIDHCCSRRYLGEIYFHGLGREKPDYVLAQEHYTEFLKILKSSSLDPQLARIHSSLIKDAQEKLAEIISRSESKQPELISPLHIEPNAKEPEPAPPLQIEEKAKTPVPLKTEPQKTSDPKSELAQLCQSTKHKLELSQYKTVVSNSGSGYTSTISAKGKGKLFSATETARSKRDAEKAAARSLHDNILAGSVVIKKKREPRKPTCTSKGKSIPLGTKSNDTIPPPEGVDVRTLEKSPPQTFNDIIPNNTQAPSPEKISPPKPIKPQNKKAVKQQQNTASEKDQADRKVVEKPATIEKKDEVQPTSTRSYADVAAERQTPKQQKLSSGQEQEKQPLSHALTVKQMKRGTDDNPPTRSKDKTQKHPSTAKKVKETVKHLLSPLKREGRVFIQGSEVWMPEWGWLSIPSYFGYQPKYPGPVYIPSDMVPTVTQYLQPATALNPSSEPLVEVQMEAQQPLKTESPKQPIQTRKRTVSAPQRY